MHPVTRLGRVIQQLKSFGDLHANELEALASNFDAASASEPAARLRMYRDMQRDEAQMVLDELTDIQADLRAAELPSPPRAEAAADVNDPAVNSPKRAKWLAKQAAEAERLGAPRSRRDLFGRGLPTSDEPSVK